MKDSSTENLSSIFKCKEHDKPGDYFCLDRKCLSDNNVIRCKDCIYAQKHKHKQLPISEIKSLQLKQEIQYELKNQEKSLKNHNDIISIDDLYELVNPIYQKFQDEILSTINLHRQSLIDYLLINNYPNYSQYQNQLKKINEDLEDLLKSPIDSLYCQQYAKYCLDFIESRNNLHCHDIDLTTIITNINLMVDNCKNHLDLLSNYIQEKLNPIHIDKYHSQDNQIFQIDPLIPDHPAKDINIITTTITTNTIVDNPLDQYGGNNKSQNCNQELQKTSLPNIKKTMDELALENSLNIGTSCLNKILISNRDERIILCSDDGTLSILDSEVNLISSEQSNHLDSITDIIQLINGLYLTCSLDTTIKLWEFDESCEHLYNIQSKHENHEIYCLTEFSENFILFGTNDIKLFALSKERPINMSNSVSILQMAKLYKEDLIDKLCTKILKFSGNRIACIYGHEIYIFKYSHKTFSHVSTLMGHYSRIKDITKTSDDLYLITGSLDGSIVIWDSKTYTCIYMISIESQINKFFVLSTNDIMYCGGDDGIRKVWLKPQQNTESKMIDNQNANDIQIYQNKVIVCGSEGLLRVFKKNQLLVL